MLEGIVRESIEKKATKNLRRDGYLIANIYGRSVENIHCAFKRNEFVKYIKNKPSLKFEVKVGGKTYPVVIQDYQKDPVTSELLHVDLRVLVKGEISTFMVPVKTVGTPVGFKNKGVLIMSKRRLKVECDSEKLPDAFVLDISLLDVGNSILVRDVTVPEGVKIKQKLADAVVGLIKAK